MSTTIDQSHPPTTDARDAAAADNDQRHSTVQAQDQPQNLGTPPDEHPHDLKSRPNDAHNQHRADTPDAAKRSGNGNGSGDDSGTAPLDVNYPPQRHAGKVGLGPHFHEHDSPTFQDKIHGLKEELKGTFKHDEKLKQQGHDHITGEFIRKQKEEEEKKNPFKKPVNENDEKTAGSGEADSDKQREGTEQQDKAHVPKETKDKEYENKA